ncbi:MAG: hypothetical protein WCP01_02020 [Methylococcaceae bacterium]
MSKDEPLTKPSRENRRNKRRWKLTEFTQRVFTDTNNGVILCLSCKSTTGIRTPNKATIGHYQTWFFCTHQKHRSILSWWGILSRPSKVWPRLGGSSNSILPTAQRLEPLGGGLYLLQGAPL